MAPAHRYLFGLCGKHTQSELSALEDSIQALRPKQPLPCRIFHGEQDALIHPYHTEELSSFWPQSQATLTEESHSFGVLLRRDLLVETIDRLREKAARAGHDIDRTDRRPLLALEDTPRQNSGVVALIAVDGNGAVNGGASAAIQANSSSSSNGFWWRWW